MFLQHHTHIPVYLGSCPKFLSKVLVQRYFTLLLRKACITCQCFEGTASFGGNSASGSCSCWLASGGLLPASSSTCSGLWGNMCMNAVLQVAHATLPTKPVLTIRVSLPLLLHGRRWVLRPSRSCRSVSACRRTCQPGSPGCPPPRVLQQTRACGCSRLGRMQAGDSSWSARSSKWHDVLTQSTLHVVGLCLMQDLCVDCCVAGLGELCMHAEQVECGIFLFAQRA